MHDWIANPEPEPNIDFSLIPPEIVVDLNGDRLDALDVAHVALDIARMGLIGRLRFKEPHRLEFIDLDGQVLAVIHNFADIT